MTTGSAGYVLDASVILKWYLRDEQDTQQADLLQDEFEAGKIDLTSPNLVRYEVACGLEIARRQGRLAAGLLPSCLTNFLALPVYQRRDAGGLIRSAMQLSAEHDVSPYDAVYLALAEQTEFGLITADQKLYRRLRDRVSYATWIGDVERSA